VLFKIPTASSKEFADSKVFLNNHGGEIAPCNMWLSNDNIVLFLLFLVFKFA